MIERSASNVSAVTWWTSSVEPPIGSGATVLRGGDGPHRLRRQTLPVIQPSCGTTPHIVPNPVAHPQPRARCQRPRPPCRAAPNALAPEIGPAERNRLRALAEDPATDDALAYVIASGPDDVTTVDLELRRPNGEVERGSEPPARGPAPRELTSATARRRPPGPVVQARASRSGTSYRRNAVSAVTTASRSTEA